MAVEQIWTEAIQLALECSPNTKCARIKGEETVALEQEQKTYEQNLDRLKGQEGKFVLIRGDDVIGVYDTYQDALKAGYEQFKLLPFLVKQVRVVENIQFFSRDFTQCPT